MTAPTPERLAELSPQITEALERVKAITSGGFCPKFDGRYKTGRAIKLLLAVGILRDAKWRYQWTDAGRALITGAHHAD